MVKKEKILQQLASDIPYAGPTLQFRSPFQLLIAAMLSAQCTDKQVNKITARLFAKYSKPEEFAALDQEQLAAEIRGCGLHRTKSLHIIQACRKLVEKYGGRVPDTLAELQSLPGVGRKTANVVLSQAFGKPAFPVDTHIYRVSRRLGLSAGNTPRQVEKDLTGLLPANDFGVWHHRLIAFGRSTCTARKPRCTSCSVALYCAYRQHKKQEQDEGSIGKSASCSGTTRDTRQCR